MSSTLVFLAGMVAGVALVVFLACAIGVYFANNIDENEDQP